MGHDRDGFTLIEVLIVVMIMAVLAATLIPKIAVSTNDAKQSALKHNMSVLRSQIELYCNDHVGKYPVIGDGGLPQITGATNAAGQIGIAGPSFPFGPYLVGPVPPNPFDDSNHVTAVAQPGKEPSGVVGTAGGWQYDETNGSVWPNHPDYYKQP
jgi:general secretion pathway protein G